MSNLGLNSFDDALSVVKECRRVSRSSGTLAITTNLKGHMREFYDIFSEVLSASGKDDYVARLHEHIQSRATVASASTLLESGGFRVKRVIERSSTMRFRDGTALLNHYFIKLGFLDGRKKVVSDVSRRMKSKHGVIPTSTIARRS